jgi:hypothetical protein
MKDSRSPDPSAPAPVGARHDDSSLFSLDALKKTEEEAARQQQKKGEDSGLIDLKALALIAQEQRPRQEMAVAAVVAPPDLFALSSPIAPIAAPPVSTAPPPLSPAGAGRARVLVAGGAVVAVVAAVSIFAVMRGSSSAAPAPSVTAGVVTPPSVTATAAQPDEPRAAAVNPGERPAPPKEEPKPVATATAAPKPLVAAPRGNPAPRPAPKEDQPPPKPVDTCDLACQMARAVNKKK